MNLNIKQIYQEKFKNYSDQELIITSSSLDYQWAAVEFLLQRMDQNYCAFRIRNKHIIHQSKSIE